MYEVKIPVLFIIFCCLIENGQSSLSECEMKLSVVIPQLQIATGPALKALCTTHLPEYQQCKTGGAQTGPLKTMIDTFSKKCSTNRILPSPVNLVALLLVLLLRFDF